MKEIKTFHNKTNEFEKELGYSADLKEMLKKYPTAIHDFLTAAQTLTQPGTTVTQGGVTVTLIDFRNSNDTKPRYKVTIDEKSFFVKTNDGYSEFENSEKTRESIKNLPWAETVDFHLGYSDQSGKQYFVSGWIPDCPTVEEYLAKPGVSDADKKTIEEHMKELETLLYRLYDFSDRNAFYDEKTKKIILFDLNTLH